MSSRKPSSDSYKSHIFSQETIFSLLFNYRFYDRKTLLPGVWSSCVRCPAFWYTFICQIAEQTLATRTMHFPTFWPWRDALPDSSLTWACWTAALSLRQWTWWKPSMLSVSASLLRFLSLSAVKRWHLSFISLLALCIWERERERDLIHI